MSLRYLLVKSNPFKLGHCGREKCWPCNGPMSIPSDKPIPLGRLSVGAAEDQSQSEVRMGGSNLVVQCGKTPGIQGNRRYNPEVERFEEMPSYIPQ